jgi:hypothetical protein
MKTVEQLQDGMRTALEKQVESIKGHLRSLGYTEFSVDYHISLHDSQLNRPEHALLVIQAHCQPWTDK